MAPEKWEGGLTLMKIGVDHRVINVLDGIKNTLLPPLSCNNHVSKTGLLGLPQKQNGHPINCITHHMLTSLPKCGFQPGLLRHPQHASEMPARYKTGEWQYYKLFLLLMFFYSRKMVYSMTAQSW